MRVPLQENQIIELVSEYDAERTRIFIINGVIGDGASCIAYKAIDKISRLPVIIKECFPHNAVVRGGDGSLVWDDLDSKKGADKRFRASFETQRSIQSSDEMTITATHLVDGLYCGNNTLYSVSDVELASTYDAIKETSLQKIFATGKAIAQTAKIYHEHGLLLLDIKPQNILILPQTREMVKLLDFDSILRKSDVAYAGVSISYTYEYAAPELLQGKRNKVCEATDIYSIGAVLFSKIMGYTPTAKDRGTFSDWDLSENPLFKRLSNKAHRLTKELFAKTLSASVRNRYQGAVELVAALDVLIEESNPKRRYLNSTYPISTNRFTGRDTELYDIHSAFLSGKRAVFIYGMGGIGKTELALQYAKLHSKNYDVIAFGRYSNSLTDMFNSTDFISIENNAESNVNLDSIRGLASENTLLIIDNFDTKYDLGLNTIMSLNCKLLFTSRYSFNDVYSNDSSIAHISIGNLSSDDQLSVFEHECGRKLMTDELDAAQMILRDIDGYTMLITLIAKQYKNDDYSLSEIQQRIHDAGIRNTSDVKIIHNKDSDIPGSTYEILRNVLSMAAFNNDEKHIMRSMSLLGDITISRKEFNAWLGNRYKTTINKLAERSWVQLQGTGEKAKISLHKVISELARNELMPDLENCKWAKELCEKIAQKINKLQTENDRVLKQKRSNRKNRTGSFGDETVDIDLEDYDEQEKKVAVNITTANYMLKLYFAILNNLDYSKEANIIFAIKTTSTILLSNISAIRPLEAIDYALMNYIFTSPEFVNIDTEEQIICYAVLSNMILLELRNCWKDKYCDEEDIRQCVDNLLQCIIAAELIVDNYRGNLEVESLMLHIYIPIMEVAGDLHQQYRFENDSFVFEASESLMELYEIVAPKVKCTPVPRDILEESSQIYNNFASIFMYATPESRRRPVDILFSKIFSEREEDIELNREFEQITSEIASKYKPIFSQCRSIHDNDKAIKMLLSDNNYEEDYKIFFIMDELRELGFDLQYKTKKEILSRCFCTDNQMKAKQYISFLQSIPTERHHHGTVNESELASQSVLLACCTGESDLTNSIEYLFTATLSSIKDGTECNINIIKFLYNSLLTLELNEYANLLIDGITKLLEDEAKETHNDDMQRYHIYCSLIELSEHAGFHKKIDHYRKMQQESLRLGFLV